MIIDPAILGLADVSELLFRRPIPVASRSLLFDLSLELVVDDEADEGPATSADPVIGICCDDTDPLPCWSSEETR